MFYLRDLPGKVLVADVTPGASVTKGTVAYINGSIGFWANGFTVHSEATDGVLDIGTKPEVGSFVIGADVIEADVLGTLDFNALDPVYAEVSGGNPTGKVKKTGATGDYLIGVCKKDYPSGAPRIEILGFKGYGLTAVLGKRNR
jgi:hypothetical protein